MDLIDDLIRDNYLRTPRIIEAFRTIKRVDFMPEDMQDLAELNEALPIGHGQTISQPLVVAFMLEQMAPQPGDKILDIGSGSGWTSALLAEIVSQQGGIQKPPKQSLRDATGQAKIKNQKGQVTAIELIPELKEFGEKNVAKYNFIEKGIVKFIYGDGSKGYEKEAPFDKILCSAAIQKAVPRAWKEQLKIGGRIVTPMGSSIWLLIKKSKKPAFANASAGEEFEEYEYPGFAFVPLIER